MLFHILGTEKIRKSSYFATVNHVQDHMVLNFSFAHCPSIALYTISCLGPIPELKNTVSSDFESKLANNNDNDFYLEMFISFKIDALQKTPWISSCTRLGVSLRLVYSLYRNKHIISCYIQSATYHAKQRTADVTYFIVLQMLHPKHLFSNLFTQLAYFPAVLKSIYASLYNTSVVFYTLVLQSICPQ